MSTPCLIAYADGSTVVSSREAVATYRARYGEPAFKVSDVPALTAYRVHRSDGSSYVTSMAAGVTLQEARAYFVGSVQFLDLAETVKAEVVNVTAEEAAR